MYPLYFLIFKKAYKREPLSIVFSRTNRVNSLSHLRALYSFLPAAQYTYFLLNKYEKVTRIYRHIR